MQKLPESRTRKKKEVRLIKIRLAREGATQPAVEKSHLFLEVAYKLSYNTMSTYQGVSR